MGCRGTRTTGALPTATPDIVVVTSDPVMYGPLVVISFPPASVPDEGDDGRVGDIVA